MVKNLIKAPLLAIFFAALLFVAGEFIPYSEEYLAAAAESGFSAGLFGAVCLLGFALFIAAVMAAGYAGAEKAGIKTALSLSVPLIGAAWAVPAAQSLLYPENAGVHSRGDAVISGGFYIACTVLAVVLFLINYKTKAPPEDTAPVNPKIPKPREPIITYKLNAVQLIVKVVVSPLIFTVLFLFSWYFLFWSVDAVRAFYGGTEENLKFLGTMATVFQEMDWMVMLALVQGLAYTLLSLPLLFLFKAKRVLYIVLTVLMYLTGVVWMYVPSPLMPDPVRLWGCIHMAALLIVYGTLMALLLSMCFTKNVELPPEEPKPVKKGRRPAAPANSEPDVLPGVSAKNAAGVVSNTISGKI
ncbi:MAG: hypothetical protein FWH02_06635 [Oscillospiraceae bacterium]|nr:hypothetical protein [Oscillospiraceae bacterium]